MASPSVEETQKQSAKNVVFVLDRSGSMTGQKIEQSKKAMEFVLRNLNEGDLFNIVAYDDRVEKYKEEMQTYNKATFDEAYTYVNTLAPGGGTNINGALVAAMESLPDNKRPTYVIFLTDGLPTAATNCTNANKIKARLFAFGVGNDVNARLLDRLSTGNGGLSEYVKPGEDIEASVAKLFSNISSPVLTDIRISFDGMDVRSTYPEVLPDMFRGGQILWVGKYTKPGKSIVTIKGKNNGVEKVYTFPVEFVSHTGTKAHDYLEKIWASRRIGYLINQIDLNGKNPELIDELVKLSKEFGILTPYTAFLAREDVNLNAVSDNLRQTEENLKELEVVRGETANEQRAYKQSMQNNSSVSGTDMAYNNSGSSAQQGTQNAPVNVNQNVKNVGSKTFYNKNDNWVDGSASAADEKNAKRVQFNSSEYFALAKGQPAEFNQYLSVGENVLVVVNGVAYQIYR
jgi:Ca-activated chloride channel family protein